MPTGPRPPWRVVATPSDSTNAALRVVEAWETGCVLSDGRELFIRWDALAWTCVELCQTQEAVIVRTWMARIAPMDTTQVEELIEIHRQQREPPPATPSGDPDAAF